MCPSVPLLEICLLTDDHHVASVKASTTVDLFSLSKEQFQDILEEYPEMKQTMSTVAVERLHKIGMNPPRKLSAHVSELFAEPVDEYQKAHEGMGAEALEGRPLRRRQVSFAPEDEVVNLRRWSDCPHFDRQTELQTMRPPPRTRPPRLLAWHITRPHPSPIYQGASIVPRQGGEEELGLGQRQQCAYVHTLVPACFM